jgi:hypothetical protein
MVRYMHAALHARMMGHGYLALLYNKVHVASHAHKRDDLYPICSKKEYGEPACFVWLYNALQLFYTFFQTFLST